MARRIDDDADDGTKDDEEGREDGVEESHSDDDTDAALAGTSRADTFMIPCSDIRVQLRLRRAPPRAGAEVHRQVLLAAWRQWNLGGNGDFDVSIS